MLILRHTKSRLRGSRTYENKGAIKWLHEHELCSIIIIIIDSHNHFTPLWYEL